MASRLFNDFKYTNLVNLGHRIDENRPGSCIVPSQNNKSIGVNNFKFFLVDRDNLVIHSERLLLELMSFVSKKARKNAS
jgi:hypothetical protein